LSSNVAASNGLGYGWLSGYPAYLIPSSDMSTIQAVDSDGSVIVYRQQAGSTTVWSPQAADNPTLTNTAGGTANMYNSSITQPGSGSTSYQWKLPDGSLRNYQLRSFPVSLGSLSVSQQFPYLTSMVDNRGNTVTFSYGDDSSRGSYGRIINIVSSNGSSVVCLYNDSGLMVKATASDGRSVDYIYNVAGDLVQVKLPDGGTYSYQYSNDTAGPSSGLIANSGGVAVSFLGSDLIPTHYLVQVTDPAGRILQNVYGGGQVLEQLASVDQTHPNSLVMTASYYYDWYWLSYPDILVGYTIVTDANGQTTQYKTWNNLITEIIDPLGGITEEDWYGELDSPPHPVSYYPNGLGGVIDKRGLRTNYQYDSRGNITQTQVSGDLVGDPATRTETATTSASYNSLNLPSSVTDASGVITTFTYDTTYPYLPAQIVTAKNSATVRTDILTYTAQSGSSGFSKGLLATKTVASGSSDQAVTSYAYNSAGLLTQQTAKTGTTDPDVVTNFAYNARGELTTVTDGDGRNTTYSYDDMSRPISKTVKDESGTTLGTWSTTYTGDGDISEVVGPRSGPANSLQRTYDSAGRMQETDVALSQAKSDGSGVVQSSDPASTDYIYDFAGNLVEQIDPFGNSVSMVYDANGQLVSKVTAGLRAESFQHEPGGKISQYTNPLGGITKTSYTATGQPRLQANPDGSVLQWRYYTDGRLQQEVLRNGSSWNTVYDDINRIVTRTLTNAAGSVMATDTSAYDRRGNLLCHTDPEGYVRTVTYDGLNRVKTATGPASVAGSAQETTTFVYGASAKTLTTRNALGEQTIAISDALGRPQQTRVLDAGGNAIRTTGYTYSAGNNATTVTEGTGAGAVFRTVYTDTLDRPVLTVLGDGSFTTKSYDLNGNLLSETDALGQTTSYAYNALNQTTSQTLPDGTVTGFAYDPAGNLLTRTMANGSLAQAQTYDSAGRKLAESLYTGYVSTRQYGYVYYPANTPAAGLLQTVTTPRDTVTTTYDDFLRPQTVATSGALPETNGTTTYSYDRRNLVTAINQGSVANAAGPATQVNRTYDGYGHTLTETVTAGGSTYANVTQTWDAAGRRSSLNDASSTLPAPLFAYQHRADGLLAQISANNQNYGFIFADNGLLTGRVNLFRNLSLDMRDSAGRTLGQTQVVSGAVALVEDMFWQANSTLSSYTAVRGGAGGWNDTRAFAYNSRGQLLTESFAQAPGATSAFNYTFDGTNPGLGVRLNAKIGAGAPASWETSATVDGLGRVIADSQLSSSGTPVTAVAVPAGGVASGADHVDILVDGVSQGRAAYPGGGAWSINLDLTAGSHTLTANAVDSSGMFTATANSSFTVKSAGSSASTGQVTSTYDADGNVISRSWGSGLTQTLTWDAFGRLIKVSQRDSANNGYDWTAIYDGLGRRLLTAQQPVANNVAGGATNVTTSIYDPQVEFLEIGVAVSGTKAWKVYGPDLNGKYGGLQGTGGLEAVILDADGTTTGVINDQFGNGVATVTGTGSGATVTWNATRVGAYGPLPGIQAQTLTDVTQVAAATAWRSRRIDPTGFYWLGARYYEPTSGRFLSADPMGQAASPSLYDYAGGDPVNSFDPDGRVNLELINPNDPAMTGDKYYNPKGVYTVSAHGSPTVIQEWVNMPGMPGGGWIQNMSPSGLAGQMAANGYTPGTPVILLSCQTGLYGPHLGSGNIAGQLSQQLSQQNQTPTIVVAPQSFEWTNPSTGEQASGLLPYWDSSSGNVSQNATNWNVYYDGVRVGTLSTDMINSPLVTDYINNTVALWQLRQMDNKLEGLEDEEAKLDELDSEMSGSAASKSSNCGGCSN
jgi:RHS repeat-associated protein